MDSVPGPDLPCAIGADKTNKTKKSLFPPPPPTPPPPPKDLGKKKVKQKIHREGINKKLSAKLQYQTENTTEKNE